MIGTREQIIERIETLLSNVTGITAVYRDRGEMPIDKLPAAILLDGSENLAYPVTPNKSGRMPPAIFILSPQIFVVLQPRDDMTNSTLNGIAAPIGPELSGYRDKILADVVNDPTLLGLLTANGQIVYRGCDTDMQTGSSMVGQLQMHFEFHYVLNPSQV